MDEIFISRCFDLALNALGNVSPNPMVGCVIVHNGKIIGEGFHQKFGEAHAEVNAVNAVKNKELLAESTVYVSLEPCSHFGKTPPCADLLIKYKVKKVVISNTDPNPMVSGNGIRKLKNAGIEVNYGILERQGYELNKRFFIYHKYKRPYIILKWAATKDGFMDIDRQQVAKNKSHWITNDKLKILVHKWRAEEDAIMVGTRTAINDNPELNVRHWVGKHPLRVVIDEKLILPSDLKLFDQSIPTWVFNSISNSELKNLKYILADFHQNPLGEILTYLYKHQITSMIVEGGRELLLNFINQNLWDEARILTGDKYFVNGLKSPLISGETIFSQYVENDKVEVVKNIRI